ncbi:hypothetical protein [Nocardia sp. NBC_00511]|uniref:hypothetical protein n=1 Tax=Nocardia sp. NBC_00511 TaxID=2903591 RepID=UPI0030E42207
MTRDRVFRAAHTSATIFWWAFIAATMVAGGIPWSGEVEDSDVGWIIHGHTAGAPRRYADYLPFDGFDITPGLTFVPFCLLVLAALVEAVAMRRVITGIITVAVPFASAALIWYAMPRGHQSFFLTPIPAVVVILAAVAIRELWARRLMRLHQQSA